VPELLVKTLLFPPWETVYSEVRKVPFSAGITYPG